MGTFRNVLIEMFLTVEAIKNVLFALRKHFHLDLLKKR